jgi:PAS domain S-box-containing protein
VNIKCDSSEQSTDLLGFRRTVVLGATGAAIVALSSLIGYFPGLRILSSIRSDFIPMAASTAYCFLILSAALFRHARTPWQGSGLLAVSIVVFLVTIFSFVYLVGNFLGMNFNFDSWLVSGAGTLGRTLIKRISPATCVGLIVAGQGVFLLLRSGRSRNVAFLRHLASSMGVLTMLIGTTRLLAYLYGMPFIYSGFTNPMTARTAIAFLFLGIALIAAAGPESFPMRLVTGDSTSAQLSRVFLPLTVALVFIQSALSQLALSSSFVNEALLAAVLAMVVGSITAFAVMHVSHSIGKKLDEVNGKLWKSEEQHRTILQTAMDGFWLTDMQGQLLEVNETYCRMSGYSVPELLTKKICDLVTGQTGDELSDQRQKIIARGEDRFESRLGRKDGSNFDVEVCVQYRETEGGQFTSFLRDITARKQAEVEKEKLQAQLNQAQKLESIGRLAGGIAHDFNNMLSIIMGYADMTLYKLQPSDPLREDMREIISACQRATGVVRQLLAFARKQTIAPKILNLNDTIKNTLNMLRRLIGEDIDLLWKPAYDLRLVKMDPSQIDQLLANLAVNARDAIKDVGKVTIETANISFDADYCKTHTGFKPGDYVMLAVSDDGSGMDKETLTNIFEPFFTTKKPGKGTGLGLATVYGIVKQNDGFINVYSEPGQGSIFKIYIPPCQCAETLTAETTVSTITPTGDETVLLVEDEQVILKLTKTMLETMGYTVLAADAPDEAVRLAQEYTGEIHVLLTDVIMPEMNGRDLAKRLLPLYPNLKTLFMSGYTANVIAHHGVLDEGVHFIQKPVSKKNLAAKIREALDH